MCAIQFSEKDTVTTDKEDDKVNANHHVREDGPSICHDAIVHNSVPVLSSEDLQQNNTQDERQDEMRQTERGDF